MKKIILSLAAITLFSSTSFAADAAGSQAGSPIASILMLVVFFAIFWFLLIRPQQKKNKELRKMLSELTKGDEVLTSGGIVGRIVKLGDTFVDLEIADNLTVKVQRNAIGNVLPKGTLKA
ncbi:preprotein translocase subunit YajC [Pseudofrancisella aestuarii]|uniref:Sec translocon accessory complex subunit YajC n=1 Tax=Pseudofrancisella aestuarii TaxID=2670347 RepID=A0ABV9T9P7_9GAMM|nr:preprotein translocase subunit YajC [Pseudofrancisella aestuarii]